MTPYEKFKSLPDAKNYLKSGVTFEILDAIADKQSDTVAAEQLQKAKQHLFNLIYEQQCKQAILLTSVQTHLGIRKYYKSFQRTAYGSR